MNTAKFEVVLQSQAEKYYLKTDRKIAKLLDKCFEQLEKNPFYYPGRINRLKKHKGLLRYRAGNLRVVYEILTTERKINVVGILPRGDIYKKI